MCGVRDAVRKGMTYEGGGRGEGVWLPWRGCSKGT